MEPQEPARVERRLAAILAADVAGYSRLIEADEEGTLARLQALRAELIDPKIAVHRGRIDEAKIMALRLLEVQPQFTIASITSAPFANPEILTALGHALRRVGLPE